MKRMRVTADELRNLYSYLTDKQIGEKFGISDRSVCEQRHRLGIATDSSYRRHYQFDTEFFEKIDTQDKAYVLGLISADGAVHKSGKQVSISLQARDEQILIDVRNAMKASYPIANKIGGSFPGSGPQKSLTLNSKKLVTDLSKYGVVNRKSHTLIYPQIPSHLDSHFVRGSFDGDGHIRYSPKKAFYFMGPDKFIEHLRDVIKNHTGRLLTIKQGTGVYYLNGYGGSKEVLDWIYKNANLCLRRKHQIYTDHW